MSTVPAPPVDARRDEIMYCLFADLQKARFNELYYRNRAASLRRWSNLSSIISALTASSVLAGMLKEGTVGASVIWMLLTLAAVVTAAANPVLQWNTRAARLEQAALGHGLIHNRVHELLRDLKLSELNESHEARMREINAFGDGLAALDEKPVQRVINKCWEQALREYPADQAWTAV
jgi:hypothetical protein